MRRRVLHAVQACLLAGPTALAFFDGGYFTGARLGALAVAWLLLAAAVAVVPGGPRLRGPALGAVGGLALLAAWTWLSAAWAPVEASAVDARERTLLYLAAMAAAALAFRDRAAAGWAEPALAAGAVVAVGYGLLDQLALVDLADSPAAGGRLYHPLTYWNAEGALAAIGLVLCARLAGTGARPLALRLVAAGAAPLLGLGVYLTFSRGSLSALAVGLLVLLALTPTWTQLRALAIAAEAAVVAVGAWEALPAGVVVVPLLALMLLAAAGQAWSAQAEEQETTRIGPLPVPGRARALAWTGAALFALAPFAAYALEAGAPSRDPAFGATAERLGSAGSNRFSYWEVAVEAWADDPAIGAGAGAFATEWVKRRESRETVRDAHGLELETAAELGLVGLALLLAAFAAVGLAATRVARHDPGFAAGPVAALAIWLAHSAIDWDWELPALTLVAAVLAGVLLGRAPARDPHVSPIGP